LHKSIAIITDIYGITPALSTWVDSLKSHYQHVHLLSPYDDTPLDEAMLNSEQNEQDEKKIYQHFIAQCGHDLYTNKVRELMSNHNIDCVLAFSAGASATWRALADDSYNVEHFIGCYPSQIRHHLDISPTCNTSLIFPDSEPHFLVDDVIATLNDYSQVQCIKTPWLHGFFNQYSAHFNASANHLLSQFIVQQSTQQNLPPNILQNKAFDPLKLKQLITEFVS